MRTLIILALSATLLTGCATGSKPVQVECGALKEYTQEFKEQLAARIENTAEEDPFLVIVHDYIATRDSIRACIISKARMNG